MTNKLLDNILKKLEDNKIKQAGSLMNSVEKFQIILMMKKMKKMKIIKTSLNV